MLQLIAAAAVGAVGFYAYSEFKKHMTRLDDEERKKTEAKRPKNLNDLEKDPKTGIYRPKRED